MILVDSSVLIDVIEKKAGWYHTSAHALHLAAQNDTLVVNAMIYAEVSRSYATLARMDEFLASTGIVWREISRAASFEAAKAHDRYRALGGQRETTLPDFFIGAHAKVEACSLLTRDPKRIRTYFPEVTLICPE